MTGKETVEEENYEEHTAECVQKVSLRGLREMFASTETEASGNCMREDENIALLLQVLSDAKDGSSKLDATVDGGGMDETSGPVKTDAEPRGRASDGDDNERGAGQVQV